MSGGLSPGAVQRLEQLAGRAPELQGYEKGELRAFLLSRPSPEQRATLERLLSPALQGDQPEAFLRGAAKAPHYRAGRALG